MGISQVDPYKIGKKKALEIEKDREVRGSSRRCSSSNSSRRSKGRYLYVMAPGWSVRYELAGWMGWKERERGTGTSPERCCEMGTLSAA